MSGDQSEDGVVLPTPMSENEVDRVIRLVEFTSTGTNELSLLLAPKGADELVDEVFSDEIHARHT